jgi:hypothetical protein
MKKCLIKKDTTQTKLILTMVDFGKAKEKEQRLERIGIGCTTMEIAKTLKTGL